jgi:hypothetical protein
MMRDWRGQTKRRSGVLVTVFVMLAATAQGQSAGGRFDGKWQTTVTCEPLRGALGFSYRFASEIKDGTFRGLHGKEDEPGYLLVEGMIESDGSASLYGKGKTNGKEYTPGRDVATGTEYGYHIKAKFTDRTGTGDRVEGRACTFEFERK